MKKILFPLLLAFISLTAGAKITLPPFIGDNMVLQQQTDAAIWGKAAPGKKVTIAPGWTRSKTVVTADAETGEWFARISTPVAGGPYDIVISDGEKLTLSNVLVGEVWYCSGQSNMEMPFKGYSRQPNKGSADIIISSKPSTPIRTCTIKKNVGVKPLPDVSTDGWKVNEPGAVANASATAYWFALKLQEALDVPVGLLINDWGGSTIEAWLSEEVIRRDFAGEFDLAYLDASEAPSKERNHKPCLIYNGQVNGLAPFTFKGMLWYQGESNRGRSEQYIRLQKSYVEMMRGLFDVPDAPFYFVQIAPYPYGHPDEWLSGYFYEAQQKSLDVIPNSGMAVTVDVGEYGTIHPCNKETVGKRLAYLALEKTYGINGIEAVAPTFKSVSFEDGKALVEFNVGPDGLAPMGQDLTGFELAGADKVFHPATGRLMKSGVSVSCPEVAEPVAVRYCFRNWGVGTLYNNYGIPAAPFRTDDWNL